MKRPLTVNNPPAGTSAEELTAIKETERSHNEMDEMENASRAALFSTANSRGSRIPAPSPEFIPNDGVEYQSLQFILRFIPSYSPTTGWTVEIYTVSVLDIRQSCQTYGDYLRWSDDCEVAAAAAGYQNFDFKKEDSLHAVITHDATAEGIADGRHCTIQVPLSWYPGYTGTVALNTSLYGQPEAPFKTGFLYCNDKRNRLPQYDITHGPLGPNQGSTQGTPKNQLKPAPGVNTFQDVKDRGWLNVATECLNPRWQGAGRKYNAFPDYQGYPRVLLEERGVGGIPRSCQLSHGYGTHNNVGIYDSLRANRADIECGPLDECGKIPACWLPTMFGFTVPSGAPTVPEYKIDIFDGLSQAEVEGDARYRPIFWDWILNHLGNRTGPFNSELPGMDKWTEASEWMFRTDKLKLSWSRETGTGGYQNHKDLRNDPLYRDMKFDWKRDVKMPDAN